MKWSGTLIETDNPVSAEIADAGQLVLSGQDVATPADATNRYVFGAPHRAESFTVRTEVNAIMNPNDVVVNILQDNVVVGFVNAPAAPGGFVIVPLGIDYNPNESISVRVDVPAGQDEGARFALTVLVEFS